MGTLNNNSGKGGGQMHDGQKNYSNSNERNPDNIRDNTRDRQYKEHDKTLTNDENYNLEDNKIEGNPDFRDTNENLTREDSDNDNQ